MAALFIFIHCNIILADRLVVGCGDYCNHNAHGRPLIDQLILSLVGLKYTTRHSLTTVVSLMNRYSGSTIDLWVECQ